MPLRVPRKTVCRAGALERAMNLRVAFARNEARAHSLCAASAALSELSRCCHGPLHKPQGSGSSWRPMLLPGLLDSRSDPGELVYTHHPRHAAFSHWFETRDW